MTRINNKGNDKMEDKKNFPILKTVFVVLLSILIICSLGVNILFSRNRTPHLMGKYIYVARDSSMNNEVPQGYAVIAKSADNLEIPQGSVVLCKLDGQDNISLRTIYKIVIDDKTGQEAFYPATDEVQGVELSIPRENIVALCSGYQSSAELGRFITFATNFKGILSLLILPCVILVILLILRISSSRETDDDDEDTLYDYSGNDKNSNNPPENVQPPIQPQPQSQPQQPLPNTEPARYEGAHAAPKPLFNPEQDQPTGNEFERKKMSIAENFSKKKVNPDSPYQKEKERTMQFKAIREATAQFAAQRDATSQFAPQRDATMPFRAMQTSTAESSFAARNVGGQSSTAPTAGALREEMLRRTAETERNAAANSTRSSTANDNTLILPASEIPRTQPLRTRQSSSQVGSYASGRKGNVPNIDDIISKKDAEAAVKPKVIPKNASAAKRSSIEAMSVDDLLKVIENEKKKL